MKNGNKLLSYALGLGALFVSVWAVSKAWKVGQN
jgi:hypothetical protein